MSNIKLILENIKTIEYLDLDDLVYILKRFTPNLKELSQSDIDYILKNTNRNVRSAFKLLGISPKELAGKISPLELDQHVFNIEKDTLENDYYRKVLFTNKFQVVLMSLKVGEEIGMEKHSHLDQFIRVERGKGKVIMNGVEYRITDGYAIIIPSNTNHNIINTGRTQLKLYTIYSTPTHRKGLIEIDRSD